MDWEARARPRSMVPMTNSIPALPVQRFIFVSENLLREDPAIPFFFSPSPLASFYITAKETGSLSWV